MSRVLWVPGKFRLTNGLLDDLRTAGYFEGVARERRTTPHAGHDLFAQHQAAVRLAAKCAAKGLPLVPMVDPGWAVSPTFLVFGHGRHDPDAWYLVAKAALDGLVDAGLLSSDRFEVWMPTGRVLRLAEEAGALAALAASEWPVRPAGRLVGMAIVLRVVKLGVF